MNHQIAFNKTRYTSALILAFSVTVLGVLMFVQPENFGASFLGHYRTQQIGLALTIIFGGVLFFTLFKLFNSKVGFVINDEGIQDFAGGLSFGLIKWENITGFEIKSHLGNKFIIVSVNNEEELLAALPKIKRRLVTENMKTFEKAVAIGTGMLKIAATDLLQLLIDSAKEKGIKLENQ
jgi:hypothetical protein